MVLVWGNIHIGVNILVFIILFIPNLIINAPNFEGAYTEVLVSYVDVYPTLCELTGIVLPEHWEGESIVDIMRNTETSGGEEYSRYPNGESVITEQYVYTKYYNRKNGEYASNMQYDHTKDPLENNNVADNPEYKTVVDELRSKLRKHVESVHWKSLLICF